MQKNLDLLLITLERGCIKRDPALFVHNGEFFAEKLDQLNDLNETFVDDWFVLIAECLSACILSHYLIVTVVLLSVLNQVRVLGEAQVRNECLA